MNAHKRLSPRRSNRKQTGSLKAVNYLMERIARNRFSILLRILAVGDIVG